MRSEFEIKEQLRELQKNWTKENCKSSRRLKINTKIKLLEWVLE